MKEALKAGGLAEDVFNWANRDYILILQTTGDNTELSVANSVWYQEDFNPDLEFIQKYRLL